VKSTKPQAKDKESRETNTLRIEICLPSSVQLNLLWRKDWSLQSTINKLFTRKCKMVTWN